MKYPNFSLKFGLLSTQNLFQPIFLTKFDIVSVPKRKNRKNHQKTLDYSSIFLHYRTENTNLLPPNLKSKYLYRTDSKFYPIIPQKVVDK